jgi:hypothetical protein
MLVADARDLRDDRGLSTGVVLPEHLTCSLVRKRLRPVQLDHPLGQRSDRDQVLVEVILDAVDHRKKQRRLVSR